MIDLNKRSLFKLAALAAVAGAAVLSVPSNEIYAAMQTGACDAGITSSTSLISFRLEEVAKHLTSGVDASYWFMLEPLMMSKAIFDKLPKNHQDIIMSVGGELEAFGKQGAQADDIEVGKVYEKAGAKVEKLDKATVEKWAAIARDTAYVTLGLGVLGFQKAQVRRRELAERYPTIHARVTSTLDQQLDTAESALDRVVDPLVSRLGDLLPGQAATVVQQVHAAGKSARRQVRSLLSV